MPPLMIENSPEMFYLYVTVIFFRASCDSFVRQISALTLLLRFKRELRCDRPIRKLHVRAAQELLMTNLYTLAYESFAIT